MVDSINSTVTSSRSAIEAEPQKETLTTDTPAMDGGAPAGVGAADPSATGLPAVLDPSEVQAFGGILHLLGDAAVGLARITGSARLQFLLWQGWAFDDGEVERLSTALARCRMRYFPTVNFAPESELLGLLAALALPLALRTAEYNRQKTAALAATAADAERRAAEEQPAPTDAAAEPTEAAAPSVPSNPAVNLGGPAGVPALRTRPKKAKA
jgi:hypothetical protein